MQMKLATAALLGLVLVAAAACGGGGDDAKITDLEERIEAAEQARQEAERQRQAEREAREAAEERADEAEKEADDAADAEAARQAELEQARQQAAEAERRAQEQIEQERQRAEAGQRGRGFLTALEAVLGDDGTTWATPGNSASAGINDRATDIVLTASPLTGSTRKAGDFYTATLMRTAPGVGQPERKIVAYTDREKSRTFAHHYASSIGTTATVGGTTANPRFTHTTWAAASTNLLDSSVAAFVSNPSRGGHPATIAAGADDPDARMVNTLGASVHGVSGHYGCYNSTTNAACKVNVAAAYTQPAGADADDPERLSGLTITPESITGETTTLYFDPGSGTISLLGVAKTGAPATTDEQYITFGWWGERPALADGTYGAAVFAQITPNTEYSGATGSAEYEGPAVGLYVDRKSDGSETTYEGGDFTATVILRATFDGTAVLTGDVTGFQTTHGAKNWHVRLNDGGLDGGTAEIVQAGTTSTGTWTNSFLARHTNAPTADTQPIAAVGRFDASIPNVRHIVGAFGAHRTTDPLE